MKYEKKFYTRFGPGHVTWVMKLEDWAIKRDDWLGRTILKFVIPWLKELWVEFKTQQTMADVDKQVDEIHKMWDSDDEYMLQPIFEVTEDPSNPFGFSEITSTYSFVTDSNEEKN